MHLLAPRLSFGSASLASTNTCGVELRGNRVLLRALVDADVDLLEKLLAEPAVAEWWPRFTRTKIESDLLRPDEDTTVFAIAVEREHSLVGLGGGERT